jgi:hypothetical protein
LLSKLIADPRFYGLVAEIDHEVVGNNFMDERSAIAGIGPITIDPTVQNRGIGRALMGDCMFELQNGAFPAFASFKPVIIPAPLYTKLGFVTREPLAVMQERLSIFRFLDTPFVKQSKPIYRPVTGCASKCMGSIAAQKCSMRSRAATVVEHDGDVTACRVVGFFGHAVGETNDGLKALIGAAAVSVPAFFCRCVIGNCSDAASITDCVLWNR